MNNETKDWRQALAEWLKDHPRTMPDDMRQLREDFVKHFPMEKLGDMTLEEYGGGKEYDGFCYWIETKTKPLGSISGGSSYKFGVYLGEDQQWHYNMNKFQSPEDALAELKNGLIALINAVQKGEFDKLDEIKSRLPGDFNALTSKMLYLYFPDAFVPSSKKEHLIFFLLKLGIEPTKKSGLFAVNRQLLNHLRSLPEFSGFDTRQMMAFFYEHFRPPQKATTTNDEGNDPDKPEKDVSLSLKEKLQPLFELSKLTRNIILYGPPGTGKTYIAYNFAQKFLEGQDLFDQYYTLVTFHQSFAYEEFIEGLRPCLSEPSANGLQNNTAGNKQRRTSETSVEYAIVPGIFKEICTKAEKDRKKKYILVIDEINRANIAKVFGELITLIEDDKRLGQSHELRAKLPYSGESFGVPDNLYIIGTMNTADRSIALLDLALRRRFAFMEVMPDPTLLEENVAGVNLQKLLEQLNRRVVALLDRDHQIGHSYLMNVRDVPGLRFAWYYRIVPLLEEYFYQDGERLQAVLGKRFVEIKTADSQHFDEESVLFDGGRSSYCINHFQNNNPGFLDALRQLAG